MKELLRNGISNNVIYALTEINKGLKKLLSIVALIGLLGSMILTNISIAYANKETHLIKVSKWR